MQLALEEAIQTYIRKQEEGEQFDINYAADNVLQLSSSLEDERERRVQEGANLGYTPR